MSCMPSYVRVIDGRLRQRIAIPIVKIVEEEKEVVKEEEPPQKTQQKPRAQPKRVVKRKKGEAF